MTEHADDLNRQLDFATAPPTIEQVAKPGTQEFMVYQVLLRQGYVTLDDTFFKPNNGINCVRLAAVIANLKKKGVLFVGQEVNGRFYAPTMVLPSGKRVARYELMCFDSTGRLATWRNQA